MLLANGTADDDIAAYRRQSSRALQVATSSLSAALLGQQSPTNDLETPEALRDYIGSGEAPAAAGFLGRRVSTPLARRQSDLQREQVWERLYEEFREHFRIRIWIICIVIGAWLVSFAYVFAWNIYALVCHSAEPCDQPLKYYLVTVFAFGQTMQPLQRFCAHGRSRSVVRVIKILGAMPGCILITWGLHMMHSCRTCQQTNPGLYYATKYFIYQQILLMIIICIAGLGALVIGVGLISWIKDTSKAGCQKAVENLPKVPCDSPELVDDADGEVMDCPICAECFKDEDRGEGVPPKVIIRTPCRHHYHKECLLRWCKNHLDCPICRTQIGELDDRDSVDDLIFSPDP